MVYKSSFGFVVGWACYLNAFISFAANATQFVDFAGLGSSWVFRPVMVATVLDLGAINYIGVRPGAFVVRLMTVGNRFFAQSREMGALPTLRAATDPAVLGGQYYGPGNRSETRGHPRLVTSSPESQDLVTQQRLWTVSEELTGVTYPVESVARVG